MALNKGIRFGVRVGGMFKNAGILVKNPCDTKTAAIVINGIDQIKTLLVETGNPDAIELASKLVAEYRN
jgi:hypothetical protein